MFDAAQGGEAQVDRFDVLRRDGFEDFGGGHGGLGSGADG